MPRFSIHKCEIIRRPLLPKLRNRSPYGAHFSKQNSKPSCAFDHHVQFPLNSEALDINQLQQIMRLTGTPPASLISRMPSHEVRHTHTPASVAWWKSAGVALSRLPFQVKVDQMLAHEDLRTGRFCESCLIIVVHFFVHLWSYSLPAFPPPLTSPHLLTVRTAENVCTAILAQV